MIDRPPLTEREIEILQQVATGASNREIAQTLSISANTVKVHVRNIFEKLGVASRTEATLVAIQSGLVEGVESDVVSAEPAWWQRAPVIAGGALLLVMVTLLVAVIASPGGPPPENTIDLEALERERWQELAPMPTARKGMAVAAYDGKIYAIAGETEEGVTGVVERYDPATDTWETLPSKPTPVTDVEAAVIGGKIYVPGGKSDQEEYTRVFEVFSPSENSWLSRSSLPFEFKDHSIFISEGGLYILGKATTDENKLLILEYDFDRDHWEVRSLLGIGVDRLDVCAIRDTVYLVGIGNEGGSTRAITFLQLSQIGNLEPRLVELPSPDIEADISSLECLGDFVFAIAKDADTPTISTYYPQRNEWLSFRVPEVVGAAGLSTTTLYSDIYFVGGEIDQLISNKLVKYLAIYTVQLPVIQQPR